MLQLRLWVTAGSLQQYEWSSSVCKELWFFLVVSFIVIVFFKSYSSRSSFLLELRRKEKLKTWDVPKFHPTVMRSCPHSIVSQLYTCFRTCTGNSKFVALYSTQKFVDSNLTRCTRFHSKHDIFVKTLDQIMTHCRGLDSKSEALIKSFILKSDLLRSFWFDTWFSKAFSCANWMAVSVPQIGNNLLDKTEKKRHHTGIPRNSWDSLVT